jgi:hypothetical protein
MNTASQSLAAVGVAASFIAVVGFCKDTVVRIEKLIRGTAYADLTCQISLLGRDLGVIGSSEHVKSLDADTEADLLRVLEGCCGQLLGLEKIIKPLTLTKSSGMLRKVWLGAKSARKDKDVQEVVSTLTGYMTTLNLHLACRPFRRLQVAGADLQVSQKFFDVPNIQVSKFVGRTATLAEIDRAFDHETTNPTVVVLTGIGGQGKTQIALEYCKRSMSKYRAIFWINTYTHDCAMRGFERVAAKLGMPNHSSATGQQKVDFVKQTLRDRPDSWLLVFDNYESATDIKTSFPFGSEKQKSAILVTSRQMTYDRLGMGIRIEALSDEEGVELLLARCCSVLPGADERKDCKAAVKRMGNLALAIDQAAAYISARRLPFACFLQDYEKRKEFILRCIPGSVWEYRQLCDSGDTVNSGLSVLTTWELSFDQLHHDPWQRARLGNFLTQAAFFDHLNVKEKLFQMLTETSEESPEWLRLFVKDGHWDTYRFQDLIVHLMNLSLIQSISITAQECYFAFHPLIKVYAPCAPKKTSAGAADVSTGMASITNSTSSPQVLSQKRHPCDSASD